MQCLLFGFGGFHSYTCFPGNTSIGSLLSSFQELWQFPHFRLEETYHANSWVSGRLFPLHYSIRPNGEEFSSRRNFRTCGWLNFSESTWDAISHFIRGKFIELPFLSDSAVWS